MIARVLALPAGASVPLRAGTADEADWHTDVARTLLDWLDPGAAADPEEVLRWQSTTAHRLVEGLRAHDDVEHAWADGATVRITLTPTCLLRIVPAVLSGLPASPHAAPDRATAASGALPEAQFAHARARNQSRSAQAHGVHPADPTDPAIALGTPDRRLLVALAGSRAALGTGNPRAVRAHARALAAAFQSWFARTRTAPRAAETITSDHRTRLALNDAVAVALATELTALGLDAPEHL